MAAGRLAVVDTPSPDGATAAPSTSTLTASVVDDPTALPAALAHLRSTMRDRLVAIDLEWTPDRRRRGGGGNGCPSPVSLVQLASATHALLIRVCCFGREDGGQGGRRRRSNPPPPLHQALAAFLADPAITVVGFAWDGGDEAKAVGTWGVGRAGGLFGPAIAAPDTTPHDDLPAPFVDAQAVARDLNYARLGLAPLASRILGVALPKPAATATSAWGDAAAPLSPAQVRYAALDALAAGHVLRGLRLLHHASRRRPGAGGVPHHLAVCPGCAVPVGAVVVLSGGGGAASHHPPCAAHRHHHPPPACGACGVTFLDARALADHARATRHGEGEAVAAGPCEGCGRWAGARVVGGGGRKRRRKVGVC